MKYGAASGIYRKQLAKIADALGFTWTDSEGFADFSYLLGPRWAAALRNVIQGVLLDRKDYPSDWLAVREYEAQYPRDKNQPFGIHDVVMLLDRAPQESLDRALLKMARKVWNGEAGRYCTSIYELEEIARGRCYPGVPF